MKKWYLIDFKHSAIYPYFANHMLALMD